MTEGQLTAGLIEFNVYGVISLYEKFDIEKAAAAEPVAPPR